MKIRDIYSWQTEKIIFHSKEFFDEVFSAIDQAKQTVRCETYILEDDQLGRAFCQKLVEAAARGVKVQLIIDGVGSWGSYPRMTSWLERQGVEVRIYHPLPWPLTRIFLPQLSIRKISAFIETLNKRNHRKCWVIDDRVAFVGSMNVHDEALTWKETGVRVEGVGVRSLVDSFQWVWQRSYPSSLRAALVPRASNPPKALVLLNHRRHLRHQKRLWLRRQMEQANSTVWLTTPYFVPTPGLIRSLSKAALRGVDVRILLSASSDHPILIWLARLFFPTLLKAGVKLFEYSKEFMHAKTILTEQLAIVGTTNLNHRSLIHDLEVDIIVLKPESISDLRQQFLKDLASSRPLTMEDVKAMSFWTWIQARFAALFKDWL